MDHIGRVEVELDCPPSPGGDDAVVGIDEDTVIVKAECLDGGYMDWVRFTGGRGAASLGW
jgi:hypothetical protein